MRCPVCGVHSYVIETRLPHRKRRCANNHLFWTEEVHRDASPFVRQPRPRKPPKPKPVNPKDERNDRVYKRWLVMHNFTEVARAFGLHPETVSAIVHKIRKRQDAGRSNSVKPKETP